ncbi:MAG: carbohydrate binding family 9 domain-containing protein [Acidobacteria bacterium]|nr:carbohydrate binding family 9 domain-containing protein [Acidobacteriota bacterium]
MVIRLLAAAALAVFATPGTALAQSATPAPSVPAAPAVQAAAVPPASAAPQGQDVVFRTGADVTVRAFRIDAPLTLDGRLDEHWYEDIAPIGGFVQQEPFEGQPATEPTELWIFYDDQNVYFAVRCFDSQPERMVANEMRHDSSNLINNEQVTFVIDTFHDRRNGFLFLINSLGGMLEEVFVDERNPSRDWNTVWNGKTARFDQGWSLEVTIPFKSLRYQPGTDQVWGLNVNRVVRWKNERQFLSPLPAAFGVQGIFRVSSAATMVGLQAPPPSKNLQVKPYTIGGVSTDRRAGIDNDPSGDFGLDVKYGITRGLTADFTYNTDFAQVEEDEQQINLTRFSLFFPEKREFFLEGQTLFNFGGRAATAAGGDAPILFFSRQVGLAGGRPVPILGGGRLTGKAGAYSIGMVNIQTEDDAAVGAEATNFTTVRVRREILSRSTIGAIFTGRSHSGVVDGSNQAFGVDALFSLGPNTRINTYLAKTWTEGRAGNDLSHRAELDYSTDRYGVNIEQLTVEGNFNPEVGFLRRTDFTKSAANLRFSPRPRNQRVIRKHYYEGRLDYYATGTGRLESRLAQATYRLEFQNSDRINVQGSRYYERLRVPFRIASNVTLPVEGYSFQDLLASYQLGQQRRVAGTISWQTGSFYNGDQTAVSYRGRVEVTPVLALEPGISVNWIDLEQGSFTTKLVSTRVTSTLTPRMFAAALIQYNSSANSFSSNVRFRWEYKLGSELFVVYSEGRNTLGAGFPTIDTRGLVVKINHLFRL